MARRRDPNRKYHDRVAGKYEQIYNDAWWQWHDGLTWDYLKPHLPSDQLAPVVDLGCGSGKWGRRVLRSGYRVTFVDLSAKMLDAARRELAGTPGADRADLLNADLVDLSALPADHFALAMAMGEPIGCTTDPARALREIHRCLAPGGILVATFDNRAACIDHFVEKGDPRELERFLRSGRTHWLTRDPTEQFEIHTFDPDRLRKLLAAAGFEVLEMIGKTVLPMRRHRDLLADTDARKRWAKIEKGLARDHANLARCAHLQITARRSPTAT